MLRNYFDIFFRKKLKKLIRKFEHIEIFFNEKKIRDFDSNKIKKNKFFYRQSNVDNVKENDDVQSAISRNESKNKKNDANIVKNEVRKTKFRTKKLKSLKIKIS